MPLGLMSGIVTWFASHLVLWSLLGFVLAGLLVFDVIPLPTTSGSVATTAAPKVQLDDRPPNTDLTDARPAQAADEGEPRPTKPKTAKRPKLIGGTIPVYEQPPGHGAGPAASTVDGFRPAAGASSPVAPSYHDEVQRARRAFWNGDFEAAEAAYMDVVEAFPDDPDAFGELGNLYEAMGKPELARDALFAAGVRLKNRGAREKLQQVIEILSKKGDERSQLLASP